MCNICMSLVDGKRTHSLQLGEGGPVEAPQKPDAIEYIHIHIYIYIYIHIYHYIATATQSIIRNEHSQVRTNICVHMHTTRRLYM
jgi:hypothetical protein